VHPQRTALQTRVKSGLRNPRKPLFFNKNNIFVHRTKNLLTLWTSLL